MTDLLLLCLAGFIAALVDSISGGGGIISLPAFLFFGMPPYQAIATNKFCASVASCTSSFKFFQSKIVSLHLIKYLLPFTILGAVFGATIVLTVDQTFLKTLSLILILALGIYTLFSKNIGTINAFKKLTATNIIWGAILTAALGFYDGFFGPGTGSFLIFGLINIYKFDFVSAAGNGKVFNFASNLVSLIVFIFAKQVDYVIGIPVALSMMLGALVGTKLAITKGVKLIKPLFIAISLSLALKMFLEM